MANNLIEAFEQYLTFALHIIAGVDLKLKQEEASSRRADSLLLQRQRFISVALELGSGLEEMKIAAHCTLPVHKDRLHESLMHYLDAEAETGNWGAGSFTERLDRAHRAKERWETALSTLWEHQSGVYSVHREAIHAIEKADPPPSAKDDKVRG